MGKDLIGTARLRVDHQVYQDGPRYLVESSTRNDPTPRYIEPVSAAAVAATANALGEFTRSIQDVQVIIEQMGPQRCGFHYSYSHKLRYEVERALLVLVARREAVVYPRGRGFEFSLVRR